jgi:mono/diheme cytochrome c family protein
MTSFEIKGVTAAVITSVFALVTTFTAGAIYRHNSSQQLDLWNEPGSGSVVKKGRTFFLQSCSSCHGSDAEGGEDAPSLQKLQISGAHMALLIQSGLKDEMPSFSKKYNEQDTAAIVAYLKTLH